MRGRCCQHLETREAQRCLELGRAPSWEECGGGREPLPVTHVDGGRFAPKEGP